MFILGTILPYIVSSFETRHRREVPDAPENYKYFLQPFVVPEAENVPQPDPLLKAQSVSESTSAKQYKPPLLTLPSPIQPSGGYQPPLPLLSSVPRSPEAPKPSAPLERKAVRHPTADITELSQSPPDRQSGAIDNRSKAVGSSHHPSQAIHQVPASEIQSDKSASAKDRDSPKNDEYVVYYYYYYDNDTNSNNLTLNFDDIPSLDSYDETKSSKEPEKSASSRSIAANVNSLTPSTEEQPKDSTQRVSPSPKPSSPSGASQARSIPSGEAGVESVIRADKPDNTVDDTVVEPLKPVSNVFRYGSNEVPRFPVLPNFIVSEVPKEVKTEDQSTPDTLSTPPSTTLPASTSSGILGEERLQPEVDADDANNVLDSDTKVVEEHEEKVAPESSTTTTTTTTTELPTTTEITTTTTEKSRRRPGGGLAVGGRRRFNSGPASTPARGRQTSTRSTASISATTSSSSSTTTTTPAPSSPRSFRGSSNRLRTRQPLAGTRPRTSLSGSTSSKPEEETGSSKAAESTATTASRSRSTAAPRRFAGGRNAASRSSSTTSTTPSARLRTTSRPRPNLITRNRPRPGFLRPRPGKEEEPEQVETTTPEPEVTEEKESISPNPVEETEPDDEEESESPDTEATEAETEEEPTTTEKSRFAALFRPRNRNALGNRPRPVIANRPPRSRR